MDEKTLERLIKCLEMTGSDQDGEALSAIRMANKILKANEKSWEGLLQVSKTQVPVVSSYQQPPNPPPNWYDVFSVNNATYKAQDSNYEERMRVYNNQRLNDAWGDCQSNWTGETMAAINPSKNSF